MRQRVLTEELVQWLSHLDSFWKTFGYKMPSSGKNTFFFISHNITVCPMAFSIRVDSHC